MSYPSCTWNYDSNGNAASRTITGSGTTIYNWDFENRLTSIALPGAGGTVTFKYDPFGRRIQKTSANGTTIYAYDGDNRIEDLDSTGTAAARYTQGLGIDEPLEVFEDNASYYYHADGLGSVTELTKKNASTVNTYFYDTFGDDSPASSETVANPFHYTARERDSETKLYFYRARYYDPTIGRFLSEDPVRFNGDTDFYLYAGNDPTVLVDPWGLQHSAGGPLHQPPGLVIHCYWGDNCSTLSWKIDWFKRIIASHAALDAAQKTARHVKDIADLQNGLENCIRIHRAKCTNKPCPQQGPVTVPSPQSSPVRIPPLPPPSPAVTIGVGATILLILAIALSPVGV